MIDYRLLEAIAMDGWFPRLLQAGISVDEGAMSLDFKWECFG